MMKDTLKESEAVLRQERTDHPFDPKAKSDDVYDPIFAFVYGIRLTLKAHGLSIDDPDAVMPIIKMAQKVVKSPRHSLVKASDDIDMEAFEYTRELEQFICSEYLQMIEDVNGND